MKRCYLLAGTLLALCQGSCGWRPGAPPPPLYYRSISVDTTALTAELTEPFPGRHPQPPNESYYMYSRVEYGITIEHYGPRQHRPYLVRYNFFGADFDKRLSRRSKSQELHHGPYGTLYADTEYPYRGMFGDLRGSDFAVVVYGNNAAHEPPEVVKALAIPVPQLSAISVVRVFRAAPEYVVAAMTYRPDGGFLALNISACQNGDWVAGTAGQVVKEAGAIHRDKSEAVSRAIEKFGLPERFPVCDYSKGPRPVWQQVNIPAMLSIVNFHYDFNRWVRQDIFEQGKRTTRYLSYVVTPEDKALEPIDRAQPLGTVKRLTDKTHP